MSCSSLTIFQLSVRTDRGTRVVKQKGDRCGQGDGRGLKTGKNVRASFMNGTKGSEQISE